MLRVRGQTLRIQSTAMTKRRRLLVAEPPGVVRYGVALAPPMEVDAHETPELLAQAEFYQNIIYFILFSSKCT
jgi:hypothetical protein